MLTAYVLVLYDYSYSEHKIMSQLGTLPCVTEVNRVDRGTYDIIIKLCDDDSSMDKIKESMGKYMTRIPEIQSTTTLIAE